MPGFDSTGPRGMGPMTGGVRGPCNTKEGFYGTNSFRPRLGRSGGRGYRNMFRATGLPGWMRPNQATSWDVSPAQTLSKEQERVWLKEQAELMKSELDAIHRRLNSLESEKQAPA